MWKKSLSATLVVLTLSLTGCGADKQPSLKDAVKKSFRIQNGMSMDEVEKLMFIEPTSQQKIDNVVIWKYEGNTQTGEDETLQVKYNNIIIKFKDGKVVKSGTFLCNLPRVKEED